jgi:hypothetical protein
MLHPGVLFRSRVFCVKLVIRGVVIRMCVLAVGNGIRLGLSSVRTVGMYLILWWSFLACVSFGFRNPGGKGGVLADGCNHQLAF